jgi:hypothetical protein
LLGCVDTPGGDGGVKNKEHMVGMGNKKYNKKERKTDYWHIRGMAQDLVDYMVSRLES